MDWSWLSGIFDNIKAIFQWVVKNLTLSNLWKGLKSIWQHLHDWYKWYQKNVQKPMQDARQNFAKLYDRYIMPILKDVNLLRRLAGLVGLFNKRLAAKLNLLFFRVEQYMLLPLQLYTSRVNALSHMMGGFLTPLGFFDNATLINSLWKNVADARAVLRNPLGEVVPAGTLPSTPTISDQAAAVSDYVSSDGGDVAASVDAAYMNFQSLIAQV